MGAAALRAPRAPLPPLLRLDPAPAPHLLASAHAPRAHGAHGPSPASLPLRRPRSTASALQVARDVQQGLGLNAALAKAGVAPDDRGGGALAGLSGGRLSRPAQMAQAVELALLHLQHRELYAA